MTMLTNKSWLFALLCAFSFAVAPQSAWAQGDEDPRILQRSSCDSGPAAIQTYQTRKMFPSKLTKNNSLLSRFYWLVPN